MSLPAAELIANSWTSAAPGYDDLFVPRFSPWTSDALEQLFFTAPSLPEGSIIVPTCGPGQELPLVSELLGNGRPIIGIDIAPGMIEIAKRRAAECGAHVSASVGDCMTLPVGPHAAILSVFGLQQLPDPPAALGNWVGTLAPGGVAVIIFWPMGAGVEAEGPWAHCGRVRAGAKGGRWAEAGHRRQRLPPSKRPASHLESRSKDVARPGGSYYRPSIYRSSQTWFSYELDRSVGTR